MTAAAGGAAPPGGSGSRAAAEFPALTRLSGVLLVVGALAVCAAALVQAADDGPFGDRATLLVSAGVVVCGAGVAGLAVRWPPGGAGRRSLTLLALAVIAGLAGLAVILALGPSGSGAWFLIGIVAASGVLGWLLMAALLRPLLWSTAAAQPQRRPALPRRAWRLCVGLGLGSALLPVVTAALTSPSTGPLRRAAASIAVGQIVRQAAEAGLGAALLAVVLLHWLHARAPQVQHSDTLEGDGMVEGTNRQRWDAAPSPAEAASVLAVRLVVLGLAALAVSGVLWAVAAASGTLDSSGGGLLLGAVYVVSTIAPLAGSAALTAGLVGLVLARSLPLLAPAPPTSEPRPEPGTDAPDAMERQAEQLDPDARWRP